MLKAVEKLSFQADIEGTSTSDASLLNDFSPSLNGQNRQEVTYSFISMVVIILMSQ